ncbi:RNA polymerase sigma factor [Nocardia salmonicida]|uniref:RNA polymerase sigma factor n=1 Tax=Nocardia salmonicida TaxID=53431 RepID=UPI0007A4BAAF|nr:sigma-70 family RNA polymerase sigma factor [Nocardia salmonicida]
MVERTDHIPVVVGLDSYAAVDNEVDLNADELEEIYRKEFTEFWEELAPEMMRHSPEYVGDTFMRLQSRWGNLRRLSPDAKRAYAYTALRYVRLDSLRLDAYRRREITADSMPDHSIEEAGYEAALADLTVAKLMGPLPLREREVMARTVQGFTAAEIAVDLGVSAKTVYTLRHRAQRRLKEMLALKNADTDR